MLDKQPLIFNIAAIVLAVLTLVASSEASMHGGPIGLGIAAAGFAVAAALSKR